MSNDLIGDGRMTPTNVIHAVPLCQAINEEIFEEVKRLENGPMGAGAAWGFGVALGVFNKHLAALSLEDVERAIYGTDGGVRETAQAVLKLLRKE